MSTKLFTGSSLRVILSQDLSHSKQVTLKPILHSHRACARTFHQHHYHHEYRSRSKGQLRLLSSGLGMTLFGAAASSDSDQKQNFGETNFDTIRPLHTRQPSSRLTLPSFTSSPLFHSTTLENWESSDGVGDDVQQSDSARAVNCKPSGHTRQASARLTLPSFAPSPAFDRSTFANRISLDDDVVDDGRLSDSARAGHQNPSGSLASASSCPRRPILFSPNSATEPHQNNHQNQHQHQQTLKKPRPNHSIRRYSSQSTLLHRRPRVSDNLPPSTRFFSTCSSSSSASSSSSSSPGDEVDTSLTPQYPSSGQSTSFSPPLRSSKSLHFTKQTASYQLSGCHPPSCPQSPPVSLVSSSPHLNTRSSHQLVPFSHYPSELIALEQYQTTPSPPELHAFPLQNSATSPPTNLTLLVKSKIQRTRRSLSHSRSSSGLSLSQPIPSCLSRRLTARDSSCSEALPTESELSSKSPNWYRSISLSASRDSLQTCARASRPPLSVQASIDHEMEFLVEDSGAPSHPTSPLRSAFSQPFLGEKYRRKTLTSGWSQSAMGKQISQVTPPRAATSMDSISRTHLPGTSSYHCQEPGGKPPNSHVGNTPSRRSVRNRFSRLARLLTPSPTVTPSPAISAKIIIPSPPSDPKSCSSTGAWLETPLPTRSRPSTTNPFNAPQVIDPCYRPSAPPMSIINWRTTLSDREYRHILETWGRTEIHRQQLLWELCQTETAFLDSLTVVLDLFIAPLRGGGKDGSWVVGVPEPVKKLFADLDQIANFHSEIVMRMSYNRMCEKKRNKSSVVIMFAEMMASFVPRLRIYEGYLVHFERVSQLIDRLSLDPADPFGSFVRMQSHAAAFGAMSLTSYLLKPIQRLMKYPLFFRQLCETTPVGHPDHQSTSDLWKATDGIIRSMQDVKGLEDDYEALKVLEDQLLGLPEGLVLADRGRKIVTRGTLQMVYPSPKDTLKLSLTSTTPEQETFSEISGDPKSTPSSTHLSSLGLHDFHSKISTKGIIRSLSPVSDSSETSETTHSQSSFQSMNTDTTFEATSSPQPPASDSLTQSRSTSGCSSMSIHRVEPAGSSELLKLKAPRSLQSKASTHKLMKARGIQTENVEVIVLSDMIILCTRESAPKKNWRATTRKSEEMNRFRVLEGIGLSMLTCVKDLAGQLGDFDDLVRLTLKPIGGIPRGEVNYRKTLLMGAMQDEGGRGTVPEHYVYLSSLAASHPSPLIGSASTAFSSSSNTLLLGEREWKNWVKAFRKVQVLNHPSESRQPNHSHPKRRRSCNPGKIGLSIKKASSMSTLL